MNDSLSSPTPWLEADAPEAARLALERFREAVARKAAPATTLDARFAGRAVRLHMLGARMGRQFGAAFICDPAPPAAPELTLHVWDGAESGAWLPSPEPDRRLPVRIGRHFAGTPSELESTPPDPGGPLVFWEPPWIYGVDPASASAWFWCPDARDLPAYVASQPALRLLHAWCRGRGTQVVHAACVAGSAGAVLLTGRGGSGKSTLALAAHLAGGLAYLGDDYVAVSDGPDGWRAHALYRTAKLERGHLAQRLPQAASWATDLGDEGDKAILSLPIDAGADGVPIRAMVLPELGAVEGLQPVGGGRLLRALAPSTLLQLPGWGNGDFQGLARFCREVPGYRLGLGEDLADAVQAVANLTGAPAAASAAPFELGPAVAPERPLVSVVIPVHNGAGTLGRAIESVLAQDYRPLEVIVVDDGSTDGSRDVAARYPDVRVIARLNGGPAAARNSGMAVAAGELLAFNDADDVWLPAKLSTQVAVLKADSGLDFVLCAFRNVPEEGFELPDWVSRRDRAGALPGYIFQAMLARRRAFEAVGWLDESMRWAEDTDWFLRAQDGGLRHVRSDEVGVHRFVHDRNLSGQVESSNRMLVRAVRASLLRRRGAGGAE